MKKETAHVQLRVGFGKHIGRPVNRVPSDYYGFMLSKGLSDAPEEVREWFKLRSLGKEIDASQHPVLKLAEEVTEQLCQ